jgi:RHS repeat-associated protein
VSTFSYDNNGNRVSFRDANNVGQDCVYDARNRDTQCTDTMGSVTKKFYDAHSNLVKTTDALLKDNLCAYDARDRKINCTDRLGGVTQYAYDLNNNLTTLTDAQNGVTSYIFDPRNLLTMETYPDTRSRTYTYDAIRRLIKRVDQTNTATGYVYDHAGRMVERVYPAGTGNDTFIYDNASRLTSAASARYNNVVNRAYDSASRITQEQLTVGATPYNIGYSYDADNRQTHVTYPDGSVVARNFTDRNQLDVVTFNNALVANFNYDNAGRKVAANFGNGITETRTYQADNLNTSINTPGVTAFAYTWDANKRKLSQTETGIPLNNQTYSYDDEDRLASFNRNNGDNQAWNLSLVGDWNQFNNNGNVENRTHNAVHEITAVDATPLIHDVKGNLTQNKNGQTYAWDIENRLTTATVPAGCPEGVTGTHTYTYDALGRRVSKTVGGNTTVFVSDGMQEIAEYVNGVFSQSYVYGSYIDEPLLKIDSAENKIYYHANNLFSIAALTDAAGTVVERYKYDPYGKATILAADGVTVRTQSLHGNPWQDRGRRTDLETGLQHYRNRMWDMNLGRFANRDPLEYVNGLNLYQGYFVPNGVDPLGLDDELTEEQIKALIKDFNTYLSIGLKTFADYYESDAKKYEILLKSFDVLTHIKGVYRSPVDVDQEYMPMRNRDDSKNDPDNPSDCKKCVPLMILINATGKTAIRKTKTKSRSGRVWEHYKSPFGIASTNSSGISDIPELGKTDNWLHGNHDRVEIIIVFKGDPRKCHVTHEYLKDASWKNDADEGQTFDEYNSYISGNQLFIYDSASTVRTRKITAVSSDATVTITKEYKTFTNNKEYIK